MSARDRRRFDGRYTYLYSAFWRDLDVKTLSDDARHLLLCLMTGSLSTQAGIFPLYLDAVLADFASAGERLTREALEMLLQELQTRPTPARSFVVRDADVLYIRDQFRNDPATRSENTRKGVLRELARLPKRSRVVRQFRRDHAEFLGQGGTQGAPQGGRKGGWKVPEIEIEKEREIKIGDGEGEREMERESARGRGRVGRHHARLARLRSARLGGSLRLARPTGTHRTSTTGSIASMRPSSRKPSARPSTPPWRRRTRACSTTMRPWCGACSSAWRGPAADGHPNAGTIFRRQRSADRPGDRTAPPAPAPGGPAARPAGTAAR